MKPGNMTQEAFLQTAAYRFGGVVAEEMGPAGCRLRFRGNAPAGKRDAGALEFIS